MAEKCFPTPQSLRELGVDAEAWGRFINGGIGETNLNRVGVDIETLLTWRERVMDLFQEFLLKSGYQDMGEYVAGLELTARNQMFRKDGELYRASAALDLPYTLTGDWAQEKDLFVAIGDAALRQEISSYLGAGMSGFSHSVDYQDGTVGAHAQQWVSVKDAPFNAVGDGVADDTEAILAALKTGKTVFCPKGIYRISDLLYTVAEGQSIWGEGPNLTKIINDVNDNPLFCFGDPRNDAGGTDWAGVARLTLEGNLSGNTLWGIFNPVGSFVAGAPYRTGQVEGVSTSPDNVYYGKWPWPVTDWKTSARGCWVDNVTVTRVRGGHAMHVSCWGFSASKVRLWSGKQGLRNSGAANNNRFESLYISGMENEGLLHPNTDLSIPTATTYQNLIVQQCGLDATGRGSIAFLKGQATYVTGLYLERNNEKGGSTDVFIAVNEIGCHLGSVRHTTDTDTPLPVIIRTEGSGTSIGSVVYGKNIAKVIHVTGTDVRTETRIEGPIRPVGSNTAADGVVVDDSTGKRTSSFLPEVAGMAGLWLDAWTRLYKAPGKRAIRQSVSTATEIALESHGSVRIVLDAGNNSTGQGLYIDHNGLDGAGENLITLSASNGSLAPGKSGTQSLGTPVMPWNIVYAVGGVVNPSDSRKKQQIRSLSDAEIRVARSIQFRAYKLNQEVEQMGDAAPTRFGVIAQEVVDAFSAQGLDALSYGVVAHESWLEVQEERNASGAVVRPYRAAGDSFLVNYGELASFILSAHQDIASRVDALEAKR